MKLSDEGLEDLAGEETYVGRVYPDFAGVMTIGYGHAIRAGERWTTLTEPEARELLHADVRGAEEHVRFLVRVPLTQDQYDALVSFVFNEGGARLATSTLLSLLNAGDYAGAASEFPRWNKYRTKDGAVHESATLTARRARERARFEREAPASPPRDYAENVQPGAVVERARG